MCHRALSQRSMSKSWSVGCPLLYETRDVTTHAHGCEGGPQSLHIVDGKKDRLEEMFPTIAHVLRISKVIYLCYLCCQDQWVGSNVIG
jgi:hypothetical protein